MQKLRKLESGQIKDVNDIFLIIYWCSVKEDCLSGHTIEYPRYLPIENYLEKGSMGRKFSV